MRVAKTACSFACAVIVLGCCGVSCRTGRANVADLSMRFTHPELYTSRYDFPRESALMELKQRGLLRRGMSQDEVRRLLGSPNYREERDGSMLLTYSQDDTLIATQESNLPPGSFWSYYLKSSGLIVEFAPHTRTARSFRRHFDEGGPKELVW
jgi:hypothetical protein